MNYNAISSIIAFLSALVGMLGGWLLSRYPRKTLTKKENAEANGKIGENYRELLEVVNKRIIKLEDRIAQLEKIIKTQLEEKNFLQSENVAYREALGLPIDIDIYENFKKEIKNNRKERL